MFINNCDYIVYYFFYVLLFVFGWWVVGWIVVVVDVEMFVIIVDDVVDIWIEDVVLVLEDIFVENRVGKFINVVKILI